MLKKMVLSVFAGKAIAMVLAVSGSVVPGCAAIVRADGFADSSTADAGADHRQERIFNACLGVLLLCDTIPTSADAAAANTTASASTDGHGGSRLSLESLDSNIDARAQTLEVGYFTSDTIVRAQMQSFFPGITLFGVFGDPLSYVSYEIGIVHDQGFFLDHIGFAADCNLPFVDFCTKGVLTSAGFTSTGNNIGAIFDARHHTVTVPPFFVNLDFYPGGIFGGFDIEVFKTLTFHGASNVEVASGQIIDPFGVSTTPLRDGMVFTEIAGAPEPGSMLLLVTGGLGLFAFRRRYSFKN